MLQRKFARLFLLLSTVFLSGCGGSAPQSAPATRPVDGILSLSPAATDLLLAIGASDRLVGVSTFDSDPRVANVPRVGDYENVDWERIATLGAKHMIVQMAPERLPSGFKERAEKLGIGLQNIHIDRLPDIAVAAQTIGDAVGRHDLAAEFVKQLDAPIAAARARTVSEPRVRTLLIISDDGTGVAGKETYLDDLLEAAGGENAVATKGYVKLDREAILALAPDAIIQLSPSPTESQRAAMKTMTQSLANLPAMKNGRELLLDDAWALMPGAHVGEIATRFTHFLHPSK